MNFKKARGADKKNLKNLEKLGVNPQFRGGILAKNEGVGEKNYLENNQ
ncbi:MAG: hypothetical protein LBE27_03045 [Deltaproteobacteria bacterium]|jgi:hypothetical protein|nr:hypothetical protein [Deltaproteobacteria bacterium]